MAVIGIDLGTTNSLCVTYRNGKSELIPNMFNEYLTPSVVCIENDRLIVGKIAKEKLVTEPNNSVGLFKRAMGTNKKYRLGNKLYHPEELSAFVVKQLIMDAENYLDEKVEEVVISVPAYFNARQRKATKSIGNILGVKIERLVNEPSAAAIACHEDDEYETFIVFDFGGGTLDLSVVDCFENVISITSICGNNHLGGSDFDMAIAHYFCLKNNLVFEKLNEHTKSSILLAAERCKISVSNQKTSNMKVSIDNNVYTCLFDESLIHDICIPILENAKPVIAKAVKDSGFKANELDSMILVGGSSKMPMVQNYLSNLLSVPIQEMKKSDILVAQGLGKYIGIKQRKEDIKDLVVTDICPFSLSTSIVNKIEPDKLLSKIVISKNTVLPTSKSVYLQTSYLGQDALDLDVYQGEEMYAKDNLFLGHVQIKVPVNKEKYEQFRLTYTYDINSMLYIEVEILSNKEKHVFQIGGNYTLENVSSIKQINEIKNISLQLNKNPEYEMTIERIKRIYTELDMHNQDILVKRTQQFITLYDSNTNNIKKKGKLIKDMNEMLDYFDIGKLYDEMDIFQVDEEDTGGMFS